MKKNLKKLLLVAVCLHTATGILNATENNPRSAPNTTKYLEYKTAVHSTCSGINFDAFNINKTSNDVYASRRRLSYPKEIYRINTNGVCRKVATLEKKYHRYGVDNILVDTKRKFIYILDDVYDVPFLFKYTLTGKFIKKITIPNNSGSDISSIENDTLGNVYVLDKTKSHIHKFSASGNFLLSWGGMGTYDGKFKEPTSLAIDKYNYIYVADSENYRIQKFDSAGNFITKWGTKASDSSSEDDVYEFNQVTTVGVDNNLNVYVNSIIRNGLSYTYAIRKFHTNGSYIGTTKIKVFRDVSFDKIDTSGNIYSKRNGTIIKYNNNYHLLDAWGGDIDVGFVLGAHTSLADIVFDSQNNMYTTDKRKASIQKFSKTGKYIRHWGERGEGVGKFGWSGTFKMAINSYNEIYVLDSSVGGVFLRGQKTPAQRIHKFNTNGVLLQTIPLPDLGITESTAPIFLPSIAIDKNNHLYVLEKRGSDNDGWIPTVHVYNRNGEKLRSFQFSEHHLVSLHSRLSIEIDKKRNILYFLLNNKVLKCTLSGKILTGWELEDYPYQIKVLKNGNLAYTHKKKFLSIYSNTGVFIKKESQYANVSFITEDKFGSIYTANSSTIYKKSVNPDIDHDGVINEKDAFPFNPNEWLDTDHDGIGNNADTDDDNDGLSDVLEKAHKLNPLNASDAQADFDHDGFSNTIEINAGTNIRSARSRPIWTPVVMGDMLMFVPAKK